MAHSITVHKSPGPPLAQHQGFACQSISASSLDRQVSCAAMAAAAHCPTSASVAKPPPVAAGMPVAWGIPAPAPVVPLSTPTASALRQWRPVVRRESASRFSFESLLIMASRVSRSRDSVSPRTWAACRAVAAARARRRPVFAGFRWGPCGVILPPFPWHQENDVLVTAPVHPRSACPGAR